MEQLVQPTDEPGSTGKRGRIVWVTAEGFGKIEDSESKFLWIFTFNRISGYHGEQLREIGLFPNREVKFSLDSLNYVSEVEFPFEDHYKRLGPWKLPFQDWIDHQVYSPLNMVYAP